MSGSLCDAVLVLVCGLPAAGKTTLVKQLVASGNTSSRLYERLSLDDLYEQQAIDDGISKPAEFDPNIWKASQHEMVLRVRNRLIENASAARGESRIQLVLLVDDNFPYRSQRKRYFHLATELHCGFGVLYMNVAVANCRARNADRAKTGDAGAQIADEVFERMVAVFEAPNGRQSPWEVNTNEVKEVGDGYGIGDAMNALIERADHELKRRHLLQMKVRRGSAQQLCDRLSTQQNVLHRVDLRLRQWISAQLLDGATLPAGMSKSQFAGQLNRRRKCYLASIKHSYGNTLDRLQNGSEEEMLISLVLQFQHQN
uniref:RxLR effector candidate protein n=1 Tax=Hyaloperonospora arabidopsidis (strain Emoy2) TaxID=559515 RepID=M4BZJ2_HYAAE